MTDEEVSKIRETIDSTFVVEGDLRRETAMNIKRLAEIGLSLIHILIGFCALIPIRFTMFYMQF